MFQYTRGYEKAKEQFYNYWKFVSLIESNAFFWTISTLIKRVKIMYPYLFPAIFKISNSLFVIYSQRLGWFNSKQKNDLNTHMIDQSI